MSDATYVVMPIQAEGSLREQDPNEVATAIEESLREKLHPEDYQDPEPEPAERGPLKKVMANSDSLYKYISWEDPVRTLGSYLGLLGLLYGVHYLHCTQLLLKMSATALGVVFFTSIVSRSTKNDFVARMRPEYKEVPEAILNATLSDIHDLVQYLAVEVQKIMYGENLGKTFGAFVSFTTLFWLIKILSPFKLEVLGLSLAYVIPLLSSPGGREIAQNAKSHAQELAHTTTESAGVAIRNGKAKAADLSHKTQQVTGDFTSRTQDIASDMSSNAQQAAGIAMANTQAAASNMTTSAKQATGNAASRTQQTASNLSSDTSRFSGVLSSKTKQTAVNIPSGVQTITGI
ncbi:Reticulon-domain-containing protein [Xylaria longipes]|nr:Reticulon-domain-containing protein [Xylaria longipes]